MPWNGSGTFALPGASFPEVNGTTIDATRFNATLNDAAAGITAALAKNGENAATANLPMGGFKHTGAGDATGTGQYIVYGQASSVSFGGALSITGSLTVGGNTTIGDAAGDTFTIAPSAITWSNNPTHSGNHTFSGNVVHNGATTLGDASGDPLTLNSSTITIPNGLNFDSNTLVIDATNNRVGIGVASPLTAFHIGGGGVQRVYRTDNTRFLTLYHDTTGGNLEATSAGDQLSLRSSQEMLFYANGSERVRIDASGNVGIGVTPTTKLDVFGNYAAFRNVSYSTYIGFGTLLPGGGAADSAYRYDGGNALFGTSSATRFVMTNDGRLYGTALHNNAGAVTGTANQYIASGTYTPTLTSVLNVTSTTARVCQWLRVGNVVTVSGSANVTFTASSAGQIDISLPIASNFTTVGQCSGVGSQDQTSGNFTGVITCDTTNDRASYKCASGAGGVAAELHFTFTYVVL